MADSYKEVKTYTYSNCVVRVHIPDLTEEERARRMKVVEQSARMLYLSREEGRRKSK